MNHDFSVDENANDASSEVTLAHYVTLALVASIVAGLLAAIL